MDRKYFYNNEFEKIDTKDKAYILGLFYSDGFVTYNVKKYNYFSAIKIIKSDIRLLEIIVEKFPFFYIITENNAASLRCNKKKFCEDLINNGVLPKKSSVNKNNLRFPNINKEFYFDFIRGYFDGDGSIYFIKKNTNLKGFTITSNNYFLIKKIKELFMYNNCNLKLSYIRGGKSIINKREIIFNSLCFVIVVQNIKTIQNIKKLFYYQDCLCLERKKEIFFYNKIKEDRPLCNRCNSDNTWWLNKNKKNIFCKNCKRSSFIDKIYHSQNIVPKFCKYCNGTKIVKNGETKQRKTKIPISYIFLCKDCNKNQSIKILPL